MGVNQMTGTPWHLETLKSNDSRRHRSNCGYYDCGYCRFYIENCRGSAHCDRYDENAVVYKSTVKKHGSKWRVHKNTKPKPKLSDLYKVGDSVMDMYFVDGDAHYKCGTILDIDSNDYIVVEFTSRTGETYTDTYHYPECIRILKSKGC